MKISKILFLESLVIISTLLISIRVLSASNTNLTNTNLTNTYLTNTNLTNTTQFKCDSILAVVASSPWVWKRAPGLFLGLRSNVHHFWEWSKLNQVLLSAHLLSFQGWLLGDPHLFNFAEVKLKDGSYKWSFNDLDDSGIGPYILDLVRFAETVKAGDHDRAASFRDLYVAYRDGVEGKFYPEPAIVEDLHEISNRQVENMYEAFIDKLVDLKTEKINYGIKSIIGFSEGPASLQDFIKKHLGQFENLLPSGSKITDVAFRTKAVGGSQGLVRVFISAKLEGEFLIYEFKPLVRAGLDYFQDQSNHQDRINNMIQYLWKNSGPTDYRYVKIDGQEFFMRVRLPKLFEIHDDYEFLALSRKKQREYLLFIAYTIGSTHGQHMPNRKDYIRELAKSNHAIYLEKFMNLHLAEAQKQNSNFSK